MTATFTDTFAELDRAVREFKQVRAEHAAWSVSWLMADVQLDRLIHTFPERARRILDDAERLPAAGHDPDEIPQVCPTS